MIHVGNQVGQFLIKAEIGKGGMGTIYFAVDTMLNRDVALKVIHPQLAGNDQLMERFKIEAMTQARMNHSNIVMIFSFNQIESEYVIAMEYVDGKSLKEMLAEIKQMPPEQAIIYMEQVLDGLHYAHDHNVIHRDIKPANILITRDNRVKISDFGIAKIFGSQGLTKTGMMVGTPWYTSPEQILGRSIDFRTDLYSLGVSFYEMVTGRVPFDSETNSEFAIQKAHLETPPPRPSLYNPRIGERLERFILRALQKNPDKRFQTAGEMKHELTALRNDISRITAMEIKMRRKEEMKSTGKKSFFTPVRVIGATIVLLLGILSWMAISGKLRLPHANTETVSTADNGGAAIAQTEQRTMTGNGQKQRAGSGPTMSQTQPRAEEKKPADQQSTLPAKSGEQVGQTGQETSINPNQGGVSEPEAGKAGEEKPATTELLRKFSGNIEQDLFQLRRLLESDELNQAEALARDAFGQTRDTRLLPFLGRICFQRNDFAGAERYWKAVLEGNGSFVIVCRRLAGNGGQVCLGDLRLRQKALLFDCRQQAESSLRLSASDITAVENKVDGIHVRGQAVAGELRCIFVLPVRQNRQEKEAFLVEFIKKYVL